MDDQYFFISYRCLLYSGSTQYVYSNTYYKSADFVLSDFIRSECAAFSLDLPSMVIISRIVVTEKEYRLNTENNKDTPGVKIKKKKNKQNLNEIMPEGNEEVNKTVICD